MSEGRVENLYAQLKSMAIDFRIRPGERINEGALSRELSTSRTPLREALNRLVAEQLIEFRPGKGFFCRELKPDAIFDLYELRKILETEAVRLACKRGSDGEIQNVSRELHEFGLDSAGKTIREVTELDEHFHMSIARLSGNSELVRHLQQINERIRFIRWIDMGSRVTKTKSEHKNIIAAIQERDSSEAVTQIRTHINMRMDQVVSAVREGVSSIYVTGPEEIFDRRLEQTGV